MSRTIDKAIVRRKGFTLGREYYCSPEIFELDIEKVFFTQWLYVGHESQIARPGDFLVYSLAGESIVVLRGEKGELRAFFNVCRHRGSRLIQEACGSIRAFRCPYHNWTYGLDGSLRGAPGMLDQISKEDFSLHPVWVESWMGLIYINLSQKKPSLSMAQMLEVAAPEMKPFGLEHTKIAKTICYEVPCNWKLFMENYRECYHCLANHPEFCGTVPIDRVHIHRHQPSTRMIQSSNLTFSKYALRPGAQTQSIDGKLVSIPLGTLDEEQEVMMHALNFYPAHAFAFGKDYGMALSLHPQSATDSLVTMHWYVNNQAVEGRDYDGDRLVAFWDITNRQDIALCAMNQQGVTSRRYTPGPYSPSEEDDIDHLLDFYLNVLQEDRN
jgi:Rieske 2Fe-2S family protein